ncbi:extracellular solute-binding protein [Candidatus Wolfebacteria bacterium]|nr:extracellular solute-binding protein [Candidatus Wolfebacteria bacterium]
MNFKAIILGLFVFFLIAGAIAFATFRGGRGDATPISPVMLWGTLSAREVNALIQHIQIELDTDFPVVYREISPDNFDRELVEALASGRGPDMIFLPQDLIMRHRDKLYAIPFESFSERDFLDRFIEEGELYLSSSGSLALPFAVDPLVLYWNRTLFANAGIAEPPRFWDEMLVLVSRLTERDERGNITRSAIALGEFGNVTHAKEIISALIMQSGNPIVSGTSDAPNVVLTERLLAPEPPTAAALRFYTEFANPVKPTYSWNRSLPPSQSAFLAGDTALYIGFASELFELREKNPNLNFDVAALPQIRGATAEKTFGAMHGAAILKSSPNTTSGFQVLSILTGQDVLKAWEGETGLPPVRRDLLSVPQTDAFRSVFYNSALTADAFLDPSPSATGIIFRDMVENITSGRADVSNVVQDASARLEQLF